MARSFNGTSDLIAMNGAATWKNTVAYSVALWVSANTAATELVCYSEGVSTSANGFIELFTQAVSTQKMGVRLRNTSATVLSFGSTATVFDNTPHHFTYTQDASGNYAAYVDGAPDASGTFSTANPPTCNRNTVGAFVRNGTGQFFPGIVWDVAKWSRQIAAGEAASLGAGLPASHINPDHYWPLWGADSPEPDIGGGTHTAGTLTGTTAATGGRISPSLLVLP